MSVGRIVTGIAVGAAIALTVSSGDVRSQARLARITATSAADLRSWDTRVTQMVRGGELRLRRSDEDTLLQGRTHERFDQYYRGVRVYGGDVSRQTGGNLTLSVFGTVYEGLAIDVTPALTPAEAAEVITRENRVTLGSTRQPRLVIYPLGDGYRLSYHAKAFTAGGGVEYFIDAQTGEVLARLDALQRQSAIGTGTGVLNDTKKMSATSANGAFVSDDALRPPDLVTFDMRENLTRTLAFLNGQTGLGAADRGTDTDNTWTDQAIVDAHAYSGYVYDYYFKRFSRRGLDNNNFRVLSLVHPVSRANVLSQPDEIIGTFYLNAFYAGDGVMVYGEGLPPNLTFGSQRFNYFAGALDIVAHELTHGVTDFTSQLIYAGEAGALNESFSDMIGTAVEFYFQPAGNAPLNADYALSEDVITPGGIRSMENPGLFGDPDHYSRRLILPIDEEHDNGGVHSNSGIGNQAFYLAIEGGTNRTSGLSVQGVGRANREQIERVMYRAFTQLMPSNATYSVARAVTIQAARDLHGAGSNAERAITQAWTAVGVN